MTKSWRCEERSMCARMFGMWSFSCTRCYDVKSLIMNVQCNCTCTISCADGKCKYASLSMCHANVWVDVQCTQVNVNAISTSECARMTEMHKSVSMSKYVCMWCLEHVLGVWMFCDNASVSCQCVKTSELTMCT